MVTLEEAVGLVSEDLRAFVDTGCAYSLDPTLAAYQQLLRAVLSARILLPDSERHGTSLAALAQEMEDERDQVMLLNARLRAAAAAALEDLQSEQLRPATLAVLRTVLS